MKTTGSLYDFSNYYSPYKWSVSLKVNSNGKFRFGFTNKSANSIKANILLYFASQSKLVGDLKLIDEFNVNINPNQTVSYDTISWTFFKSFENRAAFMTGSDVKLWVHVGIID